MACTKRCLNKKWERGNFNKFNTSQACHRDPRGKSIEKIRTRFFWFFLDCFWFCFFDFFLDFSVYVIFWSDLPFVEIDRLFVVQSLIVPKLYGNYFRKSSIIQWRYKTLVKINEFFLFLSYIFLSSHWRSKSPARSFMPETCAAIHKAEMDRGCGERGEVDQQTPHEIYL